MVQEAALRCFAIKTGQEVVGMNATLKKMTRIMAELTYFFFSVGSQGIQINLLRLENGCELHFSSGYSPSERARVNDLERFLQVEESERDQSLEEFFWQLAGSNRNGGGQDSELHLIGQLIDRASVQITDERVDLVLFKQRD